MKENHNSLIPAERIERAILFIRGQKVILVMDLANLYGVPTKQLNQQVKRNKRRFPEDFMFQLTEEEKTEVVTNCDHLSRLKYSPKLPFVFTEHGAIMAANVLNSTWAVQMGVFIVRAFIKMREQLISYQITERRLAEIEKTLLTHNGALADLYSKIRPLLQPPPESPRRRIGFRPDDE